MGIGVGRRCAIAKPVDPYRMDRAGARTAKRRPRARRRPCESIGTADTNGSPRQISCASVYWTAANHDRSSSNVAWLNITRFRQ